MVIRCQDGKLLNSDTIVEWEKQTEGMGDAQTHKVMAKTILDTSIEIFQGTDEECDSQLYDIYQKLYEESNKLHELYKESAKRDDKLITAIRRLIRTIV